MQGRRDCARPVASHAWVAGRGMNSRGPLRRSRRDRMIAGVIGGIADYFDLDPTLARIVYVLVSIFSAAFPGILVYIALWIVMPQDD